MKKTSIAIASIVSIILICFALPVSAFTVTEIASYSPSTLFNNEKVTAQMALAYMNEQITYSNLIYQTDLQNVTWTFKIYHNNNEQQARYIKSHDSAGSIPWFDIYEPNAFSYVDIYLDGTISNDATSIRLFKIWDTIDNKNAVHVYESDTLPVYNKDQPKIDLTSLKSQLATQEEYVNEMAQFSDVTPLITMIEDYKKELTKYESLPVITQTDYATLNANMDSIVHSVINYQTMLVETNLKSVSTYIQDTAYYNEFQNLYDKWQTNNFTDNAVSKSYALVYYAQQDYQNKQNMKSTIIVLVVVLIVGVVSIFFIIRNKNRKKMEEIF